MSAVQSSLACYMHSYRQYRAPSRTPVAAQRFLGIAMARAKPVHIAVVELERPIVFDETVRPIRLNTDPMLVTSMEVATAQANAHEPASHRPAHTHADSAAQGRLADSHGCACWDGWRRGQRHLIDGGRGGGAAWPRRQRGSVGMQIPGNWQVGDPGGVAVLGWGMTENGGQSDVLRCRPLPLSGAAFWLCLQLDGKLARSAGVVRKLDAGKSRCL